MRIAFLAWVGVFVGGNGFAQVERLQQVQQLTADLETQVLPVTVAELVDGDSSKCHTAGGSAEKAQFL